jgi:glycosyltransferase involved in cell wall biosynthesis
MKPKALIISLNYNPGHFSHLTANYKLFEELGYDPILYVHKSFCDLDIGRKYKKDHSLKRLKDSIIKVSVFWFPSINNIWNIIKLRFFLKSKILYVYHEPFDSIINYYKSGFGVFKILKICLINIINFPVLILAHNIILPSKLALSVYERKYKRLNKNYTLIPLLFDDEFAKDVDIREKKYISYIGTIAADHAFDNFVNFAIEAMQNNWFPYYQFLIATKSEIPITQRKLLENFFMDKKIVIQEGVAMPNSLINKYYENSAVVWNAYNRSMQSGVLPKSYMFGTPVITCVKNNNEFIDNYKTGVSLNDNDNNEEIFNATATILANLKKYSASARKKFLEIFYYKNHINTFKYIIKK